MPREYKPKAGRKRYKKPDPNIIEEAKNDVNNKGYSIRQSAIKHNIAYTVLQRHLKNVNVKRQGGQTVLSEAEEKCIAEKLLTCSEWGYPLDTYDLRMVIQQYLNRAGRMVPRFKDNLPGKEFAYSFLKRHSDMLSERMYQNIKRARAGVTRVTITEYFKHLSAELEGTPASNIINYDETNLCDDPGRKKIIAKRGCKYPERIMNHSKSSTSIMFAASGSGDLLPCYVVYKAVNMYDSWTTGGPPRTRYNRSKSGWFDNYCFEDWVHSIAIPYLKKLPGKKILIGDNLSSHLSVQSIQECSENNISFIFLPSNSTHLTQPLDVAFFKPLKVAWRKIVEFYKKGPGRKESGIPKNVFPGLLRKLLESLEDNRPKNIMAGFDKCGIIPLNPDRVLNMLPVENPSNDREDDIITSFVHILKRMRYDENQLKQRKKKTPCTCWKKRSS
nr:uncharacterized protein LOC111510230 [Leptinotarsa decemlineata]